MTINPFVMMALAEGADDDINAMKKVDDKYLEENDEYLYWNTPFMMTRIRHAMENELNPLVPTQWNTLWYSLRLKFTDDIIRKEALEFLNGKFDYRKEIYGYKIYDVMKEYGLSYPQALLKIYSLKNNEKDDTGYTLVRRITDYHVPLYTKYKIVNSILHDNGVIEYIKIEEKIKTQEEIDKEYEELEKIVAKEREERKKHPLPRRRFDDD